MYLNSWREKTRNDDLWNNETYKIKYKQDSNPNRVAFVFIQPRIRTRSLVKLDKNFTQFLASRRKPFVLAILVYRCKKKKNRGPTIRHQT